MSPNPTLYYTLGGRDQEYRTTVQERTDGRGWDFIVFHGKRGGENPGAAQNSTPLTEANARAQQEFAALERIAQGYTADPSGRPGSHPLPTTEQGQFDSDAAFATMWLLPSQSEPGGSHESNLIRVGRGRSAVFQPAGLPPPAWCAVIAPRAPDQNFSAAFTEESLNDEFAPYNQDASLTVVSGVDLDRAVAALWELATANAPDHVQVCNGGAYAAWVLSDGQLALGGFDNGGSDTAAFTTGELAGRLGQVRMALNNAHFDPEALLHPDADEDPDSRSVLRFFLDHVQTRCTRSIKP